jgi:hypothetical protein
MDFKVLKLFIFIIFISISFERASAQRTYPFYDKWKIGYNFGMTKFYGDSHDRTGIFYSTPLSKYYYQDRRFGNAINFDKSFTDIVGMRGNFFYGSVKGTKESVKRYFIAEMYQYNLNFRINFTNIFMPASNFRKWDAYGFIGIGFNVSRSWQYDMISGDLTGTNGFGNPRYEGGPKLRMTETVVPFGFGFNYSLTKRVDFNAEFSVNGVNTDKLDVMVSDERNAEGFGFLSVGISYDFELPRHWTFGNYNPSYTGRSPDKAIKEYNKKKKVIMKPKHKRKKPKYKRKRRGFFYRLFN